MRARSYFNLLRHTAIAAAAVLPQQHHRSGRADFELQSKIYSLDNSDSDLSSLEMEDFELTQRTNLLSRTNDLMPQQNSISWERGPRTSSSSQKDSATIDSSQIPLESAEPSVHQAGLPPKSYSKPSISQRVSKYTASCVIFVVCLALPLALFPAILVNSDVQEGGKDTSATTFCTNPESLGLPVGLQPNSTISTLFSITNGYGTFSFGTARFIDLVWDLVISRGGQALLAWISYRVYTNALLRIMESQLVSYNLYSTLTLSWPSILSLVPLTKSIFSLPGFRSKVLLMWLALSTLWIAFWPSITNALTGYIPENNTFVQLKNGTTFVNYNEIAIHSNIGFQCQVRYGDNDTSEVQLGPILLSTGPNVTLYNSLYQNLDTTQPFGGFGTTAMVNGGFPSTSQCGTSSCTSSCASNSSLPPEAVWMTAFWYFDNEEYTWRDFQDSSEVQCIPSGKFQWGFSSEVCFVFFCLNVLWAIGTFSVWVHMNRKSELCQKGRQLGKYRAVVDLAEAIRHDLGNDICAYSEKELDSELAKFSGVKYGVSYRDSMCHIGLSSKEGSEALKLRYGNFYGRG